MSIEALTRRINHMIATIEQQQQRRQAIGRVVLYDAATGELLPGYEPSSQAINIWIPDNGRDGYTKRVMLTHLGKS